MVPCVALLLALPLVATPEAPKRKVAVLDLATPGIGQAHGQALSRNLVGVIAAEVAGLGHEVISSADIEAMLSYEKQKDLLGCQDNLACLAEIGGALGADLVITGSVGAIGDTLSVSLSLVNAKSNRVEMRFQEASGSEALLVALVQRGVGVLFRTDERVGGTGTLLVKTEPPGAMVSVDGKDIGLSPITVDEMLAGDHVVAARHESLGGRMTVRIAPNEVRRVSLTLEATHELVALKVLSSPPEARVLLDGKDVGTTPVVLSEVTAGRHQLRVELSEHQAFETELELNYDDYVQSGQAPFKVEAQLSRRLRLLPIPLGLALGAYANPRDLAAGLAGSFELFVVPLPWLEVSLGLTRPFAAPVTIRWVPLRGALELGLVARATLIRREPTGQMDGAFGAGLSLGSSFEAPVGRLGIRFEPSLNRDMGFGYTTYPTLCSVWWSL